MAVARQRHADALRRAAEALERGAAALAEGLPLELAAADLRDAAAALDELTVRVAADEVLGLSFAGFCVGKQGLFGHRDPVSQSHSDLAQSVRTHRANGAREHPAVHYCDTREADDAGDLQARRSEIRVLRRHDLVEPWLGLVEA